MLITRRIDLENALLAEIIASFERPLLPALVPGEQQTRGSEVHLSDTLNPRQAVWKRLIPQPVTRQEAMLFMTGRGFEFDLSRRTTMRAGVSRFIENISCRPDFMEWPGYWDGPIEVKWRRANLAAQGEEEVEYESYLNQLAGYCALLTYDTVTHKTHDRGLLIVATPRQGQKYQDDLAPTEATFHLYEVVFTAQELERAIQVLRQRRDQISAALVRMDPSQVDLCAEWLCGKRRKEVIAKPRCVTCDREFETEYGIEKHFNSKKGAGHDIRHEEVKWHYEPRCRWYSFCQPEKVDPQRGGTRAEPERSVGQPGEHPAVGGTSGPQATPEGTEGSADVASQGAAPQEAGG